MCALSLVHRFLSEPESHDKQVRDWFPIILLLPCRQVCSSVFELARSGRKNTVFTLHVPVLKKGLHQVLRIDLASFSKELAPVITLMTF